MSLWYRTCKSNDVHAVFSGDGGLYVAGRWNHLGKKAIYCAQSISLASLEWLGHQGLGFDTFSYYRFSIDIPDKHTKKFSLKELPKGWDRTPASAIGKDFTDQHLYQADGPMALVLPSVVVPEEKVIVINPNHKKYNSIKASIEKLGSSNFQMNK